MAVINIKLKLGFFIGVLFLIGSGCHNASAPTATKESPPDTIKTLSNHYPIFNIQVANCYEVDRTDTIIQSNTTNVNITRFDTTFIGGIRELYGNYYTNTPVKIDSGRIVSLSGIIPIDDTRAYNATFEGIPFILQQDSSITINLFGKDAAAKTKLLQFRYSYNYQTDPMASGNGSWTVIKYSKTDSYLWTDSSRVVINMPYVK